MAINISIFKAIIETKQKHMEELKDGDWVTLKIGWQDWLAKLAETKGWSRSKEELIYNIISRAKQMGQVFEIREPSDLDRAIFRKAAPKEAMVAKIRK